MKEAKVKSYTRRTKSGKTIQVRAHSRKCKLGSCQKSQGRGTYFKRMGRGKYFEAKSKDTEQLLSDLNSKDRITQMFAEHVMKPEYSDWRKQKNGTYKEKRSGIRIHKTEKGWRRK